MAESAENTLARLVAQRLEALGTTPFAVEKRADLPSDAIRGILRGNKKSGTTLNKAKAVCDALGIEFQLGTPDETKPETAIASAEEFIRVQRFDVALSAGPGRDGDNAPPLAPVAFRLDWMKRMGLRAADCVVVGVTGDSMEPALHDGDLVMLDRRHGAIRPRAIYAAVDVSGDVVVKRLEQIDAGLLLHSDNPDYPTLFRSAAEAEQVRIIGRAVWSGHTFDGADGLTRPKARKTGLEPFEHVWI